MKILFCSSEVAPFSKSGGLADVAFSLPPALKRAGDDIMVISPLYKCVKDKFADVIQFERSFNVKVGNNSYYCGLFSTVYNDVRHYFIDNEQFFNRDKLYGYDDDKLRFAYFCQAVIDQINALEFKPQILHCNDWETALAICYLKKEANWRQDLGNIRTVYTIHNIAYQGQFGRSELTNTFGLDQSWYDGALGYKYDGREDVNLMKGAMLLADAVSTVSPTYARELHFPRFGKGLQGVVDMVENKMYGILNGIDMDQYDPSIGINIPYKFSIDDLSGKKKNKKAIQEKFGLNQQSNWPLLVSVARLVEQKGVELIKQLVPALMEMGVQIIIFGQGDKKYEEFFESCAKQYPGLFGYSNAYSEELASQIYAGADMYLMPSEFEPCGLSQMMAMRYGTVPIVHETGGLKDSVRPYSDFDKIGDGFSFANYTAKDLYLTIVNAVKLYFGDETMFHILQMRCMAKDFSWDKSANQYQRMYSDIGDDVGESSLTFNKAFTTIKKEYMKIDKVNREANVVEYSEEAIAIQVHIEGAGSGTFYIKITKEETIIEPFDYKDADAFITISYDNLYNIVKGYDSEDRLFMNGQMKITGNIAKGVELRRVLGAKKRKKRTSKKTSSK